MTSVSCPVPPVPPVPRISGKPEAVDGEGASLRPRPARPPKKERADQLIFEAGLAESREQAKRLIMAGQVVVLPQGDGDGDGDGAGVPDLAKTPERAVKVDKPGHKYPVTTRFELYGRERFVSRGAYKLLTAIEYFKLDVTGFVCLDAGASTGGFTDCLLQHGAVRVYSVDVGHNQLHERLRADGRVVSHLRTASPELIPEPVDLVVADVSFISLTLVLAPCLQWLKPGGRVVALVKPQFEVGPGQTEKGVVRDPALRQAAVDKVVAYCRDALGLDLEGVVPSAITGPKGNQEYLAAFRRR